MEKQHLNFFKYENVKVFLVIYSSIILFLKGP